MSLEVPIGNHFQPSNGAASTRIITTALLICWNGIFGGDSISFAIWNTWNLIRRKKCGYGKINSPKFSLMYVYLVVAYQFIVYRHFYEYLRILETVDISFLNVFRNFE